MRSKYAWIVLVLAVVLVMYVYLRARSGLGDEFASAGLARALGVHAGDRVPAGGRVISGLALAGSTPMATDAPLGLYPGAIVQGLTLASTPRGSEVELLLGTNDSPETVLQYYEKLWAKLHPARPKPTPSILYANTDASITEQPLILNTGSMVTVQRGPSLPPMTGAEFAAVLRGSAPLPIQRGRTATEVWLSAPVKPAKSATR